MRENLTKLCRICFGEGEYNLWDYKVQLPAELDEIENKGDTIIEEEELSVQEMLNSLNREENAEHMQHDFSMVKLICHICLDELVPSFLFCRKLKHSHKKLAVLLEDATTLEGTTEKCEQLNEEYLEDQSPELVIEEFLLETENESNSNFIEEEVGESEVVTKLETTAENLAPHFVEVLTEDQQPSYAPIEQKRRRLSKNPKIILTGGVTQMLSHVNQPASSGDEQHNEFGTTLAFQQHQAPLSQQKRLRIREREKAELEQGSFVVTQFIPSTAQVHLDSLYAHGDDDNQRLSSAVDNPLAGNELRTMDYAAVEIDASASELQVNENDTLLPIGSTNGSSGGSTQQAIYFCKYCPQAFSAANFLTTHMRKRHVCKFCTQGFRESTQLYEHIRTAHNIHKCAICYKELSTHSNLRSHIKRVHGVKLPAQVALLDFKRRSHNVAEGEIENLNNKMLVESSNTTIIEFSNEVFVEQQQIT